MEKYYTIPCVWQVAGTMKVKASSLEDAKLIAVEEAPLPTDGEYLTDSFEIDFENSDYGKVTVDQIPARIRITKVTDPNAWYADKIGQEFNVLDIWEDADNHFQVDYHGEEYDEEALIAEYGSKENIPMEFAPVEHGVLIDDCEEVS